MVKVGFYRVNGPNGYMSSLFKRPVLFGGREFGDAEHAYQFGKFSDPEVAEVAMLLPGSYLAQLAHSLVAWQVVPEWTSKLKVPRMFAVHLAKYRQHSDLAEQLIATWPNEIVEESGDDPPGKFWGVGKTGRGKNMLGRILMAVRAVLRFERGLPGGMPEADAEATLQADTMPGTLFDSIMEVAGA